MRLRPVIGWSLFALILVFTGRLLIARGFIQLGAVLISRENYKGAEVAFSKAFYIRNDSCASCGMGMVYRLQNQTSEAEQWLRKSIELDPSDTCAYNQLGRMYYDLEDYPKAIEVFSQELKLHSNSVLNHFLANSYYFSGKVEESIAYYEASARLNPKYEDVLVDLDAYAHLNRYQDAVNSFRSALKLKPKDLKARSLLGASLYVLGDREGAMEEYRKVHRVNPALAVEMLSGFEELEESKSGSKTSKKS